MKAHLTSEDDLFFSNSANWRGGPTYDIRLAYPATYPEKSIFSALMDTGQIMPWKPTPDPKPGVSKSILRIPNLPPIGLLHHYREYLFEIAEYSLSIYQVQFERAIGKQIGRSKCDWVSMDASRLITLHDGLFSLLRSIADESPLLYATLCPEHWGHVTPSEATGAICMSKGLAQVLNLAQTHEVKGADYYTCIGLNAIK